MMSLLQRFQPSKGIFLAAQDDVNAASPAGAVVPDHTPTLLAWREWAQTHAGQRCQLGLSSRFLLQSLRVVDDAPALTASQAVAGAAADWAHYLGLSGDELAAEWHVRAAALPGGWLVCASPRVLCDDLLAVARQHRVRVERLGPWWAQGLQQWLASEAAQAPGAALCLQEPGWCLVAHAESGRLLGLWAQPDGAPPIMRHVLAMPDREGPEAWVQDGPIPSQLILGRAQPLRKAA